MIDYQLKRFNELKTNTQKEYIYSVWSNNFGEMDCFGYFMEYENAYALGKYINNQFNIQVSYISDGPSKKGFPEPLDDKEQSYIPNNTVATIRFDTKGRVKLIIFND